MDNKPKAKKIVALLKKEYPEARCSLIFNKPHELVVATILSAQSTDEGVNKITPALFKKYKTPKAFANADPDELMGYIKPVGLFRNKSKAIIGSMAMVANDYRGKVPEDMDQIRKLPGVGRKTANVILGNAFNILSGIAVDTHVTRLSQRLGLSENKDPLKIEQDLMRLIPLDDWILIPHLLIRHGRKVCQARKPKCGECMLSKLCPSKMEQ